MPEALSGGQQRAWRWAVVGLGLLPHALPMSWVVSAALDGARARGAPMVLLIEIPIAVLLSAVAHDFRGRLRWVRPLVRTTAVLGAAAVAAAALVVGASA